MRRLFGQRRSARSVAVVRQVSGWLLHYPDDQLWYRLDLLEQCVDELGGLDAAAHLRPAVEYLRGTTPRAAEQHYVEVFDTKPRRGLYLTWYVHGDTRVRGGALAELVGVYREHGFRLEGGELPDYLPALLEFTATGDRAATRRGEQLLERFRPALELLARKLGEIATPYEHVVRAVLATVAESGAPLPEVPPAEQVGLDPYPRAVGRGLS
ncbi:nitrate reductase molybdenum cofactor assembly chaperone [Saccharopolyspora taberi]|uniref:Nitrate reductase molybdenum cofactor assembly chaperone n=1 Tax=Saccharopolyspora taberi TaxID=60895 RepID=A0ABN3VEB5_9PSEU